MNPLLSPEEIEIIKTDAFAVWVTTPEYKDNLGNKFSWELLRNRFYDRSIAKAQARHLIEYIEKELIESDSRNMWYLNKRFWQSLKEAVEAKEVEK